MNWKALLVATALIGAAASILIRPASADDVRITTEQEFRAKAAGKTLVTNGGRVLVGEDGTLSGKFGDRWLLGKWYWDDTFYCRNVILDGRDLGHDCQVVLVTDDGLVFHRNKGHGKKSTPYRMESGS